VKRSTVRELRAREAEERADLRRAEAERLIATHLYARRGSVARGFRRKLVKRPRGLHHTLSARHPVTRRRLLYTAALALLDLLEDDAGPPAHDSGARRVFGKTQAWYARVLGFSQKRGKNGEVYGARHVRTCLTQLAALGFIRKGGRAWFEGRPGVPRDKHKRLVLWLQPWDDTLIARLADALALPNSSSVNPEIPSEIPSSDNDFDRISGSGCFTSPYLLDRSVSGGLGSLRGKEEGASRRSFDGEASSPSTPPVDNPPPAIASATENTEGPSAPANEGEGASAGPAVGAAFDASAAAELLGVGALRVFRGAPLAVVVQHIARTHQRPVDACDGREVGQTPPAAPIAAPEGSGAVLAPLPSVAPRPHPIPCVCATCQEWGRAMFAAPARPQPPRSVSPAWVGRVPAPLVPRVSSVRAADGDSMQLPGSPGHPPACRCVLCFDAKSRELAAVDDRRGAASRWRLLEIDPDDNDRTSVDGGGAAHVAALGLIRPTATASLQDAVARRVSWQRRPDDLDYPLCAVVDGERWRLRFNGPGSPSTTPVARWRPLSLVVDGRDLGTVESWPATWSR